MGNNIQNNRRYGGVLCLYIKRLIKLVNNKGRQKSSVIFDEFPTIYLNNMDSLISTARSNKVAICLGIQAFSKLRKDYGKKQAEVIMNITETSSAARSLGIRLSSSPYVLTRSSRIVKASP